MPSEAWIDSFDDAVAIIGKQSEADRFAALLETTKTRQPEWLAWLARKPLTAIQLAEDWDRLLDIAAWCRQHPGSGIYLRQIDLPGVHTKFIESHRGTLVELLDLALLHQANWLSHCRIHYWGDIDTHGFVILDQLRQAFAHVSSLLMDQETFFAFKHLWGTESAPAKHGLAMLSPAEAALYNDLRDDRYGKSLRLEQEKIGFNWVQSVIAAL